MSIGPHGIDPDAVRLGRRLVLGGLAMCLLSPAVVFGRTTQERTMPALPQPVLLDLSGQASKGGTDLPIMVGGKAFRFNSADEPWALQGFDGQSNMLRSEIRAGYKAPYDADRDRPYFRSEISQRDRLGNTGLEQWMAFDLYMLDTSQLQPYAPKLPPGQAMVCQIKMAPDDSSGAPLFRIEARSNGMRVATAGNVGGGASDVITNWFFEAPIRQRMTERFIIQTIRSPTGTADGTLRLWRNGEKIIDQQDVALGHASTQYIWNKFGLYCRDSVTAASAIHANMDCGPDLSHLLTRPYPRPDFEA